MRRILKGIAILIAGLVGITLVAIVAAVFFINPDDYRAKLAKSVSKTIGHEVLLEGPISMHYFPWLGLQAKSVRVQASNQVSKELLADIEELSFKVETMPLLKKELNIHSIVLNNAKINLVVDKNGAASWQGKTTKSESKPAESTEKNASTESRASKLEIAEILIKNSSIHYTNNQTKQNIQLKDFNFKTNDFKKGSSIPFQSDFRVLIDQGKKLDDQVKIKAVLKQEDMKWTLKDVNLQNVIKHPSHPNKTIKADLQSTIVGDLLDKTVSFKSLSFDIDQVHGTGNATLSFAKRLHVTFDVKFDEFQADRYLAQNTLTEQELAQATALDSPFKHMKNEPSSPFSYKGNLSINRLTAKGASFSQVKMTAQNQGNGILLKPFSAGLFQGSFQGESFIQPSTRSTTIQGSLKSIDIPTLLKTFKTEPKITGTGDAQVNVSLNAKGLSGTTRFQLKNGWIEGVDLEYYLKLARSILKKQQESSDNTKRTKFNTITGTVVSNNNYLTNNDLRLEADNLYALGDGSIDINQKYIEYKFTAHRKYNDNLAHESALPLLVRVKGPFDAVKVTPDTDAYLKAFVEKEGKKQIEKQVTKHLGKILGGKPKNGDAAGSVEKNGDAADSTEEGDGNPLQDAIDKGLNKIFKF